MADAQVRVTGRNTLRDARLAQYDPASGVIQMYGCFGVGDTRVINASGEDVTPEREAEVPVLLTFQLAGDTPLISGSEVWPGDDFC